MNSQDTPDQIQGQLLATTVLLEAVLRTLPAQTMRLISGTYTSIAPEIAGHLLNNSGGDAMLDAYNKQVVATSEMLARIHQKAIYRDSTLGRS